MKKTITKDEKKELYVNPDDFWNCIRLYYSDESNKWPHKLGIMIEKIANKMRWLPNFKEYYYVDEMISDAKLKMIQVLLDKKFNLYSYTPLKPTNVKFVNGEYYIREYKRGSDLRKKVEGGKNERGMIIFLPNGEFRKINTNDDAFEEKIVEKRGNEIVSDGQVIYTLKDDDTRKYDAWEGLGLRTRNIAFGYFSQTCKNCYIARIKKEKLNEKLKHDLMEKTWNEAGSAGDGWEKIKLPKNNDDEYDFFESEY